MIRTIFIFFLLFNYSYGQNINIEKVENFLKNTKCEMLDNGLFCESKNFNKKIFDYDINANSIVYILNLDVLVEKEISKESIIRHLNTLKIDDVKINDIKNKYFHYIKQVIFKTNILDIVNNEIYLGTITANIKDFYSKEKEIDVEIFNNTNFIKYNIQNILINNLHDRRKKRINVVSENLNKIILESNKNRKNIELQISLLDNVFDVEANGHAKIISKGGAYIDFYVNGNFKNLLKKSYLNKEIDWDLIINSANVKGNSEMAAHQRKLLKEDPEYRKYIHNYKSLFKKSFNKTLRHPLIKDDLQTYNSTLKLMKNVLNLLDGNNYYQWSYINGNEFSLNEYTEILLTLLFRKEDF